jgi:O-antigen/teichoic acid export membrane protein
VSNKNDNNYELTTGDRLAKNVLWNLAGGGLPLIAGVIAIPPLVKGLGVDGFGILTLVWMLIGYFSLFDFGLGRALTKIVAEKLGRHQTNEIPSLVFTAVSIVSMFGVIGGVLVSLLSPLLTQSILKIPAALKEEALASFYILALTIPFVITSTGLKGVLEAYQRFDLLNYIRIPVGVAIFLSPLLSLPFSSALPLAVTILATIRIVEFTVYIFLCLRVVNIKDHKPDLAIKWLRPLFGFGVWMSVTNLVGPLMIYLDRFFVGAFISVIAVAYYTTPYEMVTRILIIPTAVVGVLFPAISSLIISDRGRALQLFVSSTKFIFIALFPISLVIISFSREILTIWLGESFAENSTFILQCLTFGVFINSLAQSAFVVVQGAGHPDWTAKLHLMELPGYIVLLWLLLKYFGINGAALAWVVRVLFDTLVLYWMAGRLIPNIYPTSLILLINTFIGFICITWISFIDNLMLRVSFSGMIIVIFLFVAWLILLQSNERHRVREILRILKVSL